MTAWNLGELFYAYGVALAIGRPGHSCVRIERALGDAERQFARSGARPYEIVPRHRRTVTARLAEVGVAAPDLPHEDVALRGALARAIRRIARTALHRR
jgi:hypothetical protein